MRQPTSFKDKVLATTKRHNMFEKGDKVLVAVSGGADSVSLLDILVDLKSVFNLDFHLFHLDHSLRKDSFKDALFVRQLASKYSLPITVLEYDVPSYVKQNKLSVEEGARHIRYMLLEEVAEEIGANKVALGHTASDQVETFLMRLIKGAGLEGLSAMAPARGNFVRPLIEVERSEVEKYCKKKGLAWKEDLSNRDEAFFRNRIRHQLVPLLEKYNPNFKGTALRAIDTASSDQLFLQQEADRRLNKLAEFEDNLVKIPAAELRKLPLSLQRRVLRQAIKEVKGNLKGVEFKHVEEALQYLAGKKPRLGLDVSKEISVFSEYQNVVVSKKLKESEKVGEVLLEVPGVTFLPHLGFKIKTEFKEAKDLKLRKANKLAYLDLEKLKLPLYIRNCMPGDRFRPLGLGGTKKLQDFLVDEKVPARLRGKVAVVKSGNEICWLVSLRIDDRFKVTNQTKQVLVMEISS